MHRLTQTTWKVLESLVTLRLSLIGLVGGLSNHPTMVVLITDNELYYELKCPGVTSIGRGSSNDIVPESRSISKSHAVLTLNMSSYGKLDMFLEDLNSTNGTYLGSSPLEIHRIVGKESVSFGDYLRFGHSSQYYRVQTCMAPGTGTLSVPLDRSDIQANFNENDKYYERQPKSNLEQEFELGYLSEIQRKEISIYDSERRRKLLLQDSELLSYSADQNLDQDDSQKRFQSRLSKSTPILPQENFRVENVTNIRYDQKFLEHPVTDISSKLSNRKPDEKFDQQIVTRGKHGDEGLDAVDDEFNKKDTQMRSHLAERIDNDVKGQNIGALGEERKERNLIGNRKEFSTSAASVSQQRKPFPEAESFIISINYPVEKRSTNHRPISVTIDPPKENNDVRQWEHFSSKNKSFDKNYDMMRKSHSEGNIAINIDENEISVENNFQSDFNFNHDEGFEERKDPWENIIGERKFEERKTFDCQKVDQIIHANKNAKMYLNKEKENYYDNDKKSFAENDNNYNKFTVSNKDENESKQINNFKKFQKSEYRNVQDYKEIVPNFTTSFYSRENSINWQGQVCFKNSIH